MKGQQSSLTLFEPLTREPSDLLVIVKAYSDGGLQSSYIANLSKNASYPLHHTFELKVFQDQASTAYTMEVYALGINGEQSFLLLQTGAEFVREMNLNMQLVEPIRANYQFEWLAKKYRKGKGPDWRQQDRLGVLLVVRLGHKWAGMRMIHGFHSTGSSRTESNSYAPRNPTDGSFLLSTTAAV